MTKQAFEKSNNIRIKLLTDNDQGCLDTQSRSQRCGRFLSRTLRSHGFWAAAPKRVSIFVKKKYQRIREVDDEDTEPTQEPKEPPTRKSFWRMLYSRWHLAKHSTMTRNNSVWLQNITMADSEYVFNLNNHSHFQRALSNRLNRHSWNSSLMNDIGWLGAIYTSDSPDSFFAICAAPEDTISTGEDSRTHTSPTLGSDSTKPDVGANSETITTECRKCGKKNPDHEDITPGCKEDFQDIDAQYDSAEKHCQEITKASSGMMQNFTEVVIEDSNERVSHKSLRGRTISSEFDLLHSLGRKKVHQYHVLKALAEGSNEGLYVLSPQLVQAAATVAGQRILDSIGMWYFHGYLRISKPLRFNGARGVLTSYLFTQMSDCEVGTGKIQGPTTSAIISSQVTKLPSNPPEISGMSFEIFDSKRKLPIESSGDREAKDSNVNRSEVTGFTDFKPKPRIQSPSPTSEGRPSRIQRFLAANRKRQKINSDSLWTVLSLSEEPVCERFREEFMLGDSYTLFHETRSSFDSAALKTLTLDWANNQSSPLIDYSTRGRKVRFNDLAEYGVTPDPIDVNCLGIETPFGSILKAPKASVPYDQASTKQFKQKIDHIGYDRDEKEMWKRLSNCRLKLADLNLEPTLERRTELIDMLRESFDFTKTHFVGVAKTQILDYIGYLIETRKHVMLVFDRMASIGDKYATTLYCISEEVANWEHLKEVEVELSQLVTLLNKSRVSLRETEVEILEMEGGFHEYVGQMVSRAQQAVLSRMEHAQIYLDFCGAEYIGSSIEHEPHDHTLYDKLMSELDFLIDGLETFLAEMFQNALQDILSSQQSARNVESTLTRSIEKVLSGIIDIQLQRGDFVTSSDSDSKGELIGPLFPDGLVDEPRESDDLLDTVSL